MIYNCIANWIEWSFNQRRWHSPPPSTTIRHWFGYCRFDGERAFAIILFLCNTMDYLRSTRKCLIKTITSVLPLFYFFIEFEQCGCAEWMWRSLTSLSCGERVNTQKKWITKWILFIFAVVFFSSWVFILLRLKWWIRSFSDELLNGRGYTNGKLSLIFVINGCCSVCQWLFETSEMVFNVLMFGHLVAVALKRLLIICQSGWWVYVTLP